jgi:plastocyanin
MFRISYLISASLAGLLAAASAPALGQSATSAPPHLIVVKLVQKGGPMPYAFDPLQVTVQRGDTIRFLNDVAVMHNVHFKAHPSDAKIGTAAIGPYMTDRGQKYEVVIDSRFTDGTYSFVCDPHEAIGMHGTLTVKGNAGVVKK